MAQIKVSVVILGINRSLSFTTESILKAIVIPLQKCPLIKLDVSLWLITPRDHQIANPRSGEFGSIESILPSEWETTETFTLDMDELEQSSSEIYNDLAALPDRWNDQYKSLRNLITALKAHERAFLEVEKARHPDVVIYTRPDCSINSYLGVVGRVLSTFLAHRQGRDFGSFPSWGASGGLNDRFAILSAGAARAYFFRIHEINPADWPFGFHAEEFLARAMGQCEVKSNIRTDIRRVRLGGTVARKDAKRTQKRSKLRKVKTLLAQLRAVLTSAR